MRGRVRFGGRVSARDPLRGLLGRALEVAAGLAPGEGEAAIAVAEDVRAKVQVAGAVVKVLRGRRAGRAPRVERSSAPELEAPRARPGGDVIDAEVVEDSAPRREALPVVVEVQAARRSRYD